MSISHTARPAAVARFVFTFMSVTLAFGTQAQSAPDTSPTIAAATSLPEAATTPADLPQAQMDAPTQQPQAVPAPPEMAAPAVTMPQSADPQTSGPQLMAPRTVGNVTYICGGASVEEQDQLSSLEQQYNLGVIFTKGPRGDLLAGVDVQLRRHGRVLAAFQATGPRCLFKVPPADYRVEATYKQRTQYVIFETGSLGTGIRW